MYNIEDIQKFLEDYKKANKYNINSKIVSLPLIGTMYLRKALFENQKIETFEKLYNKALSASINEQRLFIQNMTPVLDDFYSNDKLTKKH